MISRSGPLRPHAVTALAFFIGAALAFCFLSRMIGWWAVVVAGALCTGVWVATGLASSDSRLRRVIGLGAWAFLLMLYLLWAYLALTFGVLLAWAVPTWTWALAAFAAVATAATLLRPLHRLRVPPILPLGIWIAAALAAWGSEENWLRCDDYLALRPPVQLVVPSHPDLASCRAGEVRAAGRFPRTIWQDPDGKRVVFTTQGDPVAGGIGGSVCEARLAGDDAPHCVGLPRNKSQGLVDLPERGRLIVMQWGVTTPAGVRGAVALELSRDQGLAILGEHWFDNTLAEGFYEPRNSTLYLFSDKMDGIHRFVLPGFEPASTIPINFFTPGELHYDPVAGEGVGCGSRLATAIRGEPFLARNLADGNSSLIEKLSLSWGCDWDPAARKVYVAVPNLGLLVKLDYDTGQVEKRWFVGPGTRSVAYDPVRRRVYLTDFLRGEVIAFDERTERVVDRWFVGRYSRWVRLTRDGHALLATSNLGIVRIPLDG